MNAVASTTDTYYRYIAIDLKSFYASVECRERGLDPLTTNLVVADPSRTEKTICLAVTPALKAYGIPGRARLFEVIQAVEKINTERKLRAPKHCFTGKSTDSRELAADPSLELDFIVAVPRMQLYVDYSTNIYRSYLRYIAPEDILIYSIDEVFIDTLPYRGLHEMDTHTLAMTLIRNVLQLTGITATAGLGTNLYLSKIAMDIVAKHIPADKDGVRIAELDEMSYRRKLWEHQPLTDFWRVGRGYTRKLKNYGIRTMGDIAVCSLKRPKLLYELFGVNAELLIDHAWGYEPCTLQEARNYEPESNSLSSGQVLHQPYNFTDTRLIVREMTEQLVLELVEKGLCTKQMTLTIRYDTTSLANPEVRLKYQGRTTIDHYGRETPQHAHGTASVKEYTSSNRLLEKAVLELYDRIVDPLLLTRYITVCACNLLREEDIPKEPVYEQMDLFTDYEALEKEREAEHTRLEKEKALQHATLDIRRKFGGNALLKGSNLYQSSTARDRNSQIGGHKK